MTATTYKAPSMQLVVPAHVAPFGWATLDTVDFGKHVVPVQDNYPHYARNCACQPLQVEDDRTQHYSFDRREDFEARIRKPS